MNWNQALKYLDENKEWIFSGIGVLIISVFYSIFRIRKREMSSTTININSEFSLVEVKEIAESVFYKNFPTLLESAKTEANRNKDLFILELIKTIEARLDNIEYIAFRTPDIQYMLLESTVIASRKDSPKKRELLSNLIVNRVKSNDYEFGEIIYNDAIKAIALLTTSQIKILTLIEIISSFIYLIIKEEFAIEIENVTHLLSFLNEPIDITVNDLEHLKNVNLLSSTFPYELDRAKIINYKEEKFKTLTIKCNELISNNLSLEINKMKLTLTGKAIAQINISLILETEFNNLKRGPMKLSDFRAQNIYAEGEVTAFSK